MKIVRQRSLTYLTVLFTLLLPLLGTLWVRSYLFDQTVYRVGPGRTLVLNCIRGELALWSGPTRQQGPVRYGYESSGAGYAMTAAESMAHDRSDLAFWAGGFGYARTYAMAPRELGPVWCLAVPVWFLTLVAAAFPARLVMRQVRRSRAAAEAELARCRRCGAALAADDTRCAACSFPAFIRQGVVA